MKEYAYNKRGLFDFEVLEKLEAGIVLLGIEVKSVRKGNINLTGAFVTFHEGEAYLTNATISPWQPHNTPDSYEPTRSRKLLLRSSELKYLLGKSAIKGLTIIPIRVYDKGLVVKVEIGVAKGKKLYQKKEQRRERDIRREVERELRGKE